MQHFPMPMQPSGQQLEQLQSALLDAFDHAALAQLVRYKLDLDLEWITPVQGQRDLTTIVADLVAYYASQAGGIKRLLAAARDQNQSNPALIALANGWAELDFAPLPLPENHPSMQASQRGVAAGNDIKESILITGDGNTLQQIDTGGGTSVQGNVEAGNDFVGRDKHVGGDEVKGNKVELHIGQIIQQAQQVLDATKAEGPAPGDPPYKGLQFFGVDDAGIFFGREQLTAKLVSLLRQQRLLVVIGASGSGKSSLVRAGLVASLRRGSVPGVEVTMPNGCQQWPVYLLTPGARPLESLAVALTHNVESVTATSTLIDDLRGDVRSLHLYSSRLLNRTSAQRLLLVVDQFEELFTLCRDVDEQRAFVDALLTAALDYDRTIVVITLRADFYAACARFEKLRAALESYQKFIGLMNRRELQQAIELPAQQGGWTLETGLIEQLLADVSDEPGSLPLLSHALDETWQRRRGRQLTLAGYVAAGGIKGAIAHTADTTYQAFSPTQQTIARAIFLRLTELGEGVQDTRRRVARTELQFEQTDPEQVAFVLKTLADARLVTTDADEVQVMHEAIIREWPRLRDEWLADNREGLRIHRRLTEAAQEWHANGRDANDLYRGSRLSQAQEWASDHSADLNQIEQAFLQASQAENDAQIAREAALVAEREANRQRELEQAQQLAAEAQARRQVEAKRAKEAEVRRQVTLISAIIVAIVMAVLAYYGWNRAEDAQEQTRLKETEVARAESAESVARARLLISQGEQVYEENPLLGVRLALEGLMVVPPDKFDAQNMILASVRRLAAGGQQLHLREGELLGLDPHGRYFVVKYQNGSSELRRIDGEAIAQLPGNVSQVSFDPSGSHLFYLRYSESYTSTYELRRTADGSVVQLTDEINEDIYFEPSGHYFFVTYKGELSEIRRVSDYHVLATLHQKGSVSFNGGREDSIVVYMSINNESERVADDKTAIPIDQVNKLFLDPNGNYFFVKYRNGLGQLTRVSNGEVIPLSDKVDEISFDLTGRYFTVTYGDASIELRSTVDDKVITTLTGRLNQVFFDPTGRHFIMDYRETPGELRQAGEDLVVPLAGEVYNVYFDSTRRYFFVTYQDGEPSELRRLTDGQIITRLAGKVNNVWFDPSNQYFVVVYEDDFSELRRFTDGQIITRLAGKVNTVWFDPSNRYFVVVYEDDSSVSELRRLISGEMVTPLGGRVEKLSFEKSGSYVIIEYTNRVNWEVRRMLNGEVVSFPPGVRISFDSSGRYFVEVYEDGFSELRQVADNKMLIKLPGKVEWASVDPSGTYVFVTYKDKPVELRQIIPDKDRPIISQVREVFFDPSGRYLVVKYLNESSELRQIDGKVITQLPEYISQISFDPSGSYLFFSLRGHSEGYIPSRELRRTADGSVVQLTSEAVGIFFADPSGQYFTVSYRGSFSELRQTADGSVVQLTSEARYISFDPNGRYITVSYMNGAEEFRDQKGNYFVIQYDDASNEIRQVIDGKKIATLTGTLSPYIPQSSLSFFDPSGRYFVVDYWWSPDELRDAVDGIVATLAGSVFHPFFAPNGNYVVLDYSDIPDELRSTADGKVLSTLGELNGQVSGVAFDPSGSYVYVTYGDKSGSLMRLTDGWVLQSTIKDEQISFDPKGRYFVVMNSYHNRIELKRLSDGQRFLLLPGGQDVVFDPSGRYFVVDNILEPDELRDAFDGKVIASLAGKIDEPVSFDPKGQFFLVKYADGRSDVWDILGRRLIELRLNLDKFMFDSTGQYLLVHHKDGHIYILNLDWREAIGDLDLLSPEKLEQLACRGPFASGLFNQYQQLFQSYLEDRPSVACQPDTGSPYESNLGPLFSPLSPLPLIEPSP